MFNPHIDFSRLLREAENELAAKMNLKIFGQASNQTFRVVVELFPDGNKKYFLIDEEPYESHDVIACWSEKLGFWADPGAVEAYPQVIERFHQALAAHLAAKL